MEMTLNNCFSAIESDELELINGGLILCTIVIGTVTYELTLGAAAAILAGIYGISYALAQGYAHYKNRYGK